MRFFKKCSATILTFAMIAGTFAVAPISADALTPTYECSESYMSSEYYTNLCNVVLTGNGADDIVNVALSQVGYHEGDLPKQLNGKGAESGNYSEYAYFSNNTSTSYGAWCAYFVNWCARQAGISTQILYGKDGYVPNLAKFYKKCTNGTWYKGPAYGGDYIPKKGDIVIFDFDNDYNGGDHVAIMKCDSATGDFINVVGGNEGDSVHDGFFSAEYTGQRTINSVMGYFHPNYAINSFVDDPTHPDNYACPTSVLKNGATGEGVKWVQAILYRLDYFESPSEIDGKFGDNTERAVKEFQEISKLTADGIVGPQTITALGKAWDAQKNSPVKSDALSGVSQFSLLCNSTLNLVEDPSQSEAAQLTWVSSDETVATVKNGIVTGIKEGTATIIALLGKEEIKSYVINVEAAPKNLVYGDVNCDGKVSMEDVTDLQVIMADLKTYDLFGENSQAQADVTRDSLVSMFDVVHIQQYIASLVTIE